VSRMGPTSVAASWMKRSERAHLAREVQELDREHPEWSAATLEAELKARHAVLHGNWADETPNLSSRLRAVQRWRGASGAALASQQAKLLFPYLWPLGERQRHELEPTYQPSARIASGSWRLFLFNCGPEVLREIHVGLDGSALGYSPFLPTSKFFEVLWQRRPQIGESALSGRSVPSRHALTVSFVLAKGTRNGRLTGELVLDPDQGWTEFDAGDGRTKEIE
jgi:hypothetical protein